MRHKTVFVSFVLVMLCLLTASCGRRTVVRFAVISDTHIGGPTTVDKTTKSLRVLCSKEPRIDAIFVVGDLTDNGKPEQYDKLAEIFSDRTIVPEGVAVYMMMGNNHDKTTSGGIQYFTEKTGQPLRHYVDIKGFPFIAFSEGGSRANEFNDDVKQWLAETMADAAKKYLGKPIFAFSHVPPMNTCYGSLQSEGWGTDIFLPIYNRYPQAVVFGGHSHYPLGDPRSIHQDKFTSVNDGSVYYSEVAPGEISKGIHPEENGNVTEGVIVNVMSDNSIEIERWDTFRDEEILPRWTIEAPHDGSRFAYRNRDGLPAPAFPAGAAVKGYIDGDEYVITVPQASDNDVVFKYDIDFIENDTVAYSYNFFSLFYLNSEMPDEITYRIPNVPKGRTLTVEAVATDSYGNRSEPLTGETFIIADKK